MGLFYCCTFLALCIYRFCTSRVIVTNEIYVLQFLISLYVGFWTLKHLFVCTILALLYNEVDHRIPIDTETLDFLQRLCSSIATKLLYVIILLRIYYTFKETIHKLSNHSFVSYLVLLVIAWAIDVVGDILVVLHRHSIFHFLYAVAVSIQIALGIVFIYQFNHRLFQLILAQSNYDYHYGSTTKGFERGFEGFTISPPQHSVEGQNEGISASNSIARSVTASPSNSAANSLVPAPNSIPQFVPNSSARSAMSSATSSVMSTAKSTAQSKSTSTLLNRIIAEKDRADSLLLNPKQVSLLDIITKNSLLASTAIIAYDIFIILYVALELIPFTSISTHTMIVLFYVQSVASFIEMLCIYLTFNWGGTVYTKCCGCCHTECLKCCRNVAKRKIARHCRHHSVYSIPLGDTELL